MATLSRVVSLGLALGASADVSANTYLVTSAADDNTSGTLRMAVASADAAPPSTVQFDPSLTNSTITLTNGQIPVTTVVTVQGPGAAHLTVSGNNASRIFQVTGKLTISGLTLTAGNSSGKGGAINAVNSNLTLQDAVLSGNSAQDGGAIYAGGSAATTTLTNVVIQNNTANARAGISLLHGTDVLISASVISGNSAQLCCGGGYVGQLSGTTTISNSRITNNHAMNGNGGGLALGGNAVHISNSTIADNANYGVTSKGGGLWLLAASTTIDSTHIIDNQSTYFGGGVYFGDISPASATLDVERSTISGNVAARAGGGIAVGRAQLVTIGGSLLNDNRGSFTYARGGALSLSGGGSADLHDSTMYGNYAYSYGGAIDILGSTTGTNTTMTSMTIVGNSTRAYESNGVRAAGTPTITSSILANNVNVLNNPSSQELFGTFKVTYSDVKTRGSAAFAAGSGNNLPDGTDPDLGPLAINGGPTLSMLPNPGSPVLGTGNAGVTQTVDQRGLPRKAGGLVDMGAVEVQNPEDVIFRDDFEGP
jgi:predicted outer membrane repeat protein